jgi:hypothetical protein
MYIAVPAKKLGTRENDDRQCGREDDAGDEMRPGRIRMRAGGEHDHIAKSDISTGHRRPDQKGKELRAGRERLVFARLGETGDGILVHDETFASCPD